MMTKSIWNLHKDITTAQRQYFIKTEVDNDNRFSLKWQVSRHKQCNGEYRPLTLACKNPSENSLIMQMISRSGTMHTTGQNKAFTDSGSSVWPAYPGITVTNIPTFGSRAISCSPNYKKSHMKIKLDSKRKHLTCLHVYHFMQYLN